MRRLQGAMASRARVDAAVGLETLPRVILQHILALSPVDARARAACVCRALRDAAADPAVWTRLDMSAASGMTCTFEAALRGALARSSGIVEFLDVSGHHGETDFIQTHLPDLLAEHGSALRELRAHTIREPNTCGLETVGLHAILQGAPLLRILDAHVECYNTEEGVAWLRNEPPYGALRIPYVCLCDEDSYDAPRLDIPAVMAAARTHASLAGLQLYRLSLITVADTEAVVDAALALRLSALHLVDCWVDDALLPTLFRLLHGPESALRTLLVEDAKYPHPDDLKLLGDEYIVAQLADALRCNTTLTTLSLGQFSLGSHAVVLLLSLLGHCSLHGWC